ncbi:hypothetical protein P8452_13492 [Trifolium repens]|nr:hypothetical protein P8452_13492 [Trifolium repens]
MFSSNSSMVDFNNIHPLHHLLLRAIPLHLHLLPLRLLSSTSSSSSSSSSSSATSSSSPNRPSTPKNPPSSSSTPSSSSSSSSGSSSSSSSTPSKNGESSHKTASCWNKNYPKCYNMDHFVLIPALVDVKSIATRANQFVSVTNQELFVKTLVSLVVMESLFTSMARKTITSTLFLIPTST